MRQFVCSFLGHRKIKVTLELKKNIYNIVEDLIVHKNVTCFLFGSRSEFDSICLDIVTCLKSKYQYIKTTYIRAEYQFVNCDYENYMLEKYDLTFFPPELENTGKLIYIKRNQIMIDKSDYVIFYFNNDYIPPKKESIKYLTSHSQSGTKIAYAYAKMKNKTIFNLFY